MAYDFDLFVIGGGSGGVRCARIAAGYGAKVGIAEERYWGGTCVNVGCVPKKLMVMAAEYGNAVTDSHGFGWDTVAGRHDWAKLIAAKDAEIDRLNGIYRRLMAGCTVFDARATFIDAHTLDVGGQRVTAQHIVIAVGGRPAPASFPGGEHAILSDDIFHLDIRTGLDEAMQAQGITIHRGVTIADVSAGKTVTLSDASSFDTDLVFSALGRAPYTAGLGLEAAGVSITAHGAIAVDGQCNTSAPGVYAIGDVTDRLNLTPVAIAEGHSLADRLFGPGPRVWRLDAVATAVFTSPPIGTVGLTEAQAAANGPTDIYLAKFTPMRHTLSGRARKTTMKLVVDQATQRVVGAHMLGEDAPEILQGLSIALNAGATKADFDRTVGIHPTAAEEFVTMRTRTRVAGE